jgi:hypothetical protein
MGEGGRGVGAICKLDPSVAKLTTRALGAQQTAPTSLT